MSDHNEDRSLRDAFASMRNEEVARVTAFRRILQRERVPQVRTVLVPAVLALTVVVALGLVIGQVLRPSDPIASPSLAEWTEPTAFLLRTPAHDFLSSVPTFGRATPDLGEKGVTRHE